MFKLPAFVRWTSRRTSAPAVDDSLEAFASESSSEPMPAAPNRMESVGRRTAAAGILAFSLLPALVFGSYALDWVQSASDDAPLSASLTIESDPSGAEVHMDGSRKGTTPLTLRVAPGPRSVEVVLGEHRQTLSAVAREGADIVHRVAFVAAPAAPAVPVKTSGSARRRAPAPARGPVGPVVGRRSVEPASARLDLAALPRPDARPVGAMEIGAIGVRIETAEPIQTTDPLETTDSLEKVPTLPPSRAVYVRPVAVQEELPPWTPPSGLAGRAEYVGVFRIWIGEDGQVTGSKVLEASHPAYDAQLSRAVVTWLYRPATRDGRPVPSVKDIRIRLVPR